MADENDAGAAYLASLRQSTRQSTGSHAAGAAPARAREVPASAETHGGVAPPGKTNRSNSDKRNSPRYKCGGSARLQEIGSTVATWATLADISMHGCYVETAAPLHLGASIGLKLDANGFRVEATGEVRVIYSGLGMGISFTKVSEENRGRLRELVRSLSPTSVILSPRTAPGNPSPPAPRSDVVPAAANAAATLQAILTFFEDRHVMGREEFLKILRKSQ